MLVLRIRMGLLSLLAVVWVSMGLLKIHDVFVATLCSVAITRRLPRQTCLFPRCEAQYSVRTEHNRTIWPSWFGCRCFMMSLNSYSNVKQHPTSCCSTVVIV